MSRRPPWRTSVVARLIALAAFGLLLPAAVLFALQYRALLDLQAKTKNATRETLRQSLYLLSSRIQHEVLALSDQLLRGYDAADADRLDAVHARMAQVPECGCAVGQIFFIADRPGKKPALLLLDWSHGEEPAVETSPNMEVSRRIKQAYLANFKARPLPRAMEPSGSFTFHQEWADSDLYVFRSLTPAGAEGKALVFVGFTIKASSVRRPMLPGVVAHVRREPGAGPASDVAFGVLDDRKREIIRFSDARVKYEQSINLLPMFGPWLLAAGYAGATLDDLARAQFRANLLLTVLVLAFLIAGSLLRVRAAAREAKLAQLKSSFVSNVSHEMKTPLALIRLFAETLEAGRVSGAAKIQEYYHVIHRESRRLTQLVDNILDFSRMEAGRKQYEFTTGDIGEFVAEVVHGYEDHIRNAGFDLHVDVEDGLPEVRFDATALAQALMNLLDNSIKYSAADKTIAVVVRRRGERVAIEVADRGIGIPKADQQRIFEKFYRVDTEEVRTTRGSGLGLALAKHIVDAHGGEIQVESAPGEGSRFTIVVPAVAAAAAVPA